MKEITDEFKEKLDKKIELAYENNKLKFELGKHEIKIPKKIIYSIEKKMRFYEVEDIEDIKKNYDVLSNSSHLPLNVLFWALRVSVPLALKDESLRNRNLEEEEEYYSLTHPGPSKLIFNFNHISIDNVYLRNFNFIKRKSFEACKFDIKDRYDETIEGVFVYNHVPGLRGDESAKEQLEKVLASPEITAFDLQFFVLHKNYKIKKGLIDIPRSKKLLVKNIHKSEGKSKDIDTPYDSTKLPILELLLK